MKKREILSYSTIAVLSILLILSNINFQTVPTYVHKDPQIEINVYCVESIEGIEHLLGSGNLITDIGENATMDGLFGNTYNISGISSGNATVGAALTKLTTEATTSGFDRQAPTVSELWFNSGDIARNYTCTFTATADIAVNAVGLHWSVTDDSNNNMFACAYITDGSYHQFPLSDPASTLTVKWVITINAN